MTATANITSDGTGGYRFCWATDETLAQCANMLLRHVPIEMMRIFRKGSYMCVAGIGIQVIYTIYLRKVAPRPLFSNKLVHPRKRTLTQTDNKYGRMRSIWVRWFLMPPVQTKNWFCCTIVCRSWKTCALLQLLLLPLLLRLSLLSLWLWLSLCMYYSHPFSERSVKIWTVTSTQPHPHKRTLVQRLTMNIAVRSILTFVK